MSDVNQCCMAIMCLLPQSCAQRGYCRLDRENQRAERRGVLPLRRADHLVTLRVK